MRIENICQKKEKGMKIPRSIMLASVALVVVIGGFGCVSDYGVTKSNKEEWLENYDKSPLVNAGLSFRVKNYLQREDLFEEYQTHPRLVLKQLNQRYLSHPDNATLFTLTELSYEQGTKKRGLDALSSFFSCTIYASIYLSGKEANPYSPLFFTACRYYNYASAEILKIMQEEKIPLEQKWDLPVIPGRIVIEPAQSELPLPLNKYSKFISCFDYLQFGFQSYSRTSGLGMPLIAVQDKSIEVLKKYQASKQQVFALAQLPYPTTLFIRIKPLKLPSNFYSATLEFKDPYKTDSIVLNNKTRAIMATDLTTPLAYMANEGASYSGFSALKNFKNMTIPEGLYLLTPYDKNKIPVVFVHGLMSTPRTWLQMTNTLLGNLAIRQHYQFWYFAYPTGLPILYSAKKLRNALLAAQAKFDPQHDDPAFNDMVIVGHSMGGLLTKAMVIDTGDKLIKAIFDEPIDKLDITAEQRNFLESVLCFKPLPFITEVIFMATPHRGSKLAEQSIMRFAATFITLPRKFLKKIDSINREVLLKAGIIKNYSELARLTGVKSLDPNNKSLEIMCQLPIKVEFHSIIGDQEKAGRVGGSDGIVSYKSSHIVGAKSELVVKSGHNVQDTAEGIKEVRRILLQHLDKFLKQYGNHKKITKPKKQPNRPAAKSTAAI